VGKNKLAKFVELESFNHVIQAPFNQIKNNDFFLKGKWCSEFFKNENPLILELGCGKGEYTVELAEKNPGANFIGIDVKGARLWKGAKQALQKQLQNVAFLRTNIEIISQFFGEDEVTEIWLTFPDPQMKKTRKRLTSTTFLHKYKSFLKKDGVIYLKTDSNFQYAYTRALAHLNELDVIAETNDLYSSDLLDETLQIKTFYEKQWLNRGITIKYIAFRLNKNELKEPEIDIKKDEYRSFGRSARETK
jgi:tRNA (guanine-N7-)-methyltransferase